MLSKKEVKAKLAKIESDHADVLSMRPIEVFMHENRVQMPMKLARAIGMIDALNAVLGRETDNSRYPAMVGWKDAAADAGLEPWASERE